MFVNDECKPANRIISESNLEFIFNLDDESMLVRVFTLITKTCRCIKKKKKKKKTIEIFIVAELKIFI